MKILSQSEQWPDRCAANRHPMHPEDDPSPSDFAEEDFEKQRRQRYPRGEGPPLQGEDDPHDLDPEGASLDDHDPQRYLADPFPEEEVDDWPDPDIGHAPGPHPFGTPVYTPGGGIPHEDYDPGSLDNLPPDEPGGEDVRHFGAKDKRPACEQCGHPASVHSGIAYGARWTDKEPCSWCGCNDYASSGQREAAVNADNALDPENEEYFYNRDPELAKTKPGGSTVPYMHGGDPEGAVSIEPHESAGPHDAQVLRKEQTGLEYDVIARPSPDGKGWDVLKSLG